MQTRCMSNSFNRHQGLLLMLITVPASDSLVPLQGFHSTLRISHKESVSFRLLATRPAGQRNRRTAISVGPAVRSRCHHLRMQNVHPPEFSRPHSVGQQKHDKVQVTATAQECEGLVERFDLESLGGLSANLTLSLVDRSAGRVRARGKFCASDVRCRDICGDLHTLQFDAVEFETCFVPEERLSEGPIDINDPNSFDEPIENGQIDLGELVSQHFYLHLDEFMMDMTGGQGPPEGTLVYSWDE
uniref:Uncharacterized protein n=1 Tax=Chrysotila carterae TaxID=13221 RepID=A0A7S4F666_CHRCT